MKKTLKNYVPPQDDFEIIILEQSLLIASVNVPGTTVDDAEEEEWIVS